MAEINTNSVADIPAGLVNFVSGFAAKVADGVNDVVSRCHKEAAVAMGLLSAFHITPVSNHYTTSALLIYGGATKIASAIINKLGPTVSNVVKDL